MAKKTESGIVSRTVKFTTWPKLVTNSGEVVNDFVALLRGTVVQCEQGEVEGHPGFVQAYIDRGDGFQYALVSEHSLEPGIPASTIKEPVDGEETG